jgi:NAD-dependent SIR2 family protein deacetylase
MFTLKSKNDRLAEVHGRLGLYKWFVSNSHNSITISSITPNCRFTYEESIADIDLDELAVEGTSMAAGNLQLREPPACPDCRRPVLPQSLLFDELYESHSHYSWDKCLNWMEEADVFIFIGTSFSVGVTAEAIDIAKNGKKIVFNFNLTEEYFDCET